MSCHWTNHWSTVVEPAARADLSALCPYTGGGCAGSSGALGPDPGGGGPFYDDGRGHCLPGFLGLIDGSWGPGNGSWAGLGGGVVERLLPAVAGTGSGQEAQQVI